MLLYNIALTFALGVHPLFSMELGTEFTTREGKLILIDSLIVSNLTIKELNQQKAHLNQRLTLGVWKVLLDVFSMNKLSEQIPTIEFDRKAERANPFCKHNVGESEADEALQVASTFTLSAPAYDQMLCSYALFYEGKIKAVILAKLDEHQKIILDKFCYLISGKHLDVPEELKSSVSLQEFVTFNKMPLFFINNDGQALHLNLSNRYLSNLDSWPTLLKEAKITPECVTVLDLSNNNLKAIETLLLTNFINLQVLSLAQNQLEALPNDLLKDCSSLIKLDVSNNLLKDFSPLLIASCNQLQELLIDNNSIQELSATLNDNKFSLRKIRCDAGVKTDDTLKKKITYPAYKLSKKWKEYTIVTTLSFVYIVLVIICAWKAKNQEGTLGAFMRNSNAFLPALRSIVNGLIFGKSSFDKRPQTK